MQLGQLLWQGTAATWRLGAVPRHAGPTQRQLAQAVAGLRGMRASARWQPRRRLPELTAAGLMDEEVDLLPNALTGPERTAARA